MTIALRVGGWLNGNVYTAAWLLIWVSNVIERIVAKINVVVASSTLVLSALAKVTGIVLGASISYPHDDTGAVTSAIAGAVVLAPNLKLLSAHGSWTRRTLTLAEVSSPAVLAVALATSWVTWVVLAATTNISDPELRTV